MTLKEHGSFGARLQCDRAGRPMIEGRAAGVAHLRTPPVFRRAETWAFKDGLRPPVAGGFMVSIAPGAILVQQITLPPGRWDLSMQYSSTVFVQFAAGDKSVELLPEPDTFGQVFRLMEVESTGSKIPLSLTAFRPRLYLGNRSVQVGTLVATRVDDPPATMPMRKACGQFVDWYTSDTSVKPTTAAPA